MSIVVLRKLINADTAKMYTPAVCVRCCLMNVLKHSIKRREEGMLGDVNVHVLHI